MSLLIFIHNGKTGGSSVRASLDHQLETLELHGPLLDVKASSLEKADIVSLHETNFSFQNAQAAQILADRSRAEDVYVLTLTRNPYRLLESQWNFALKTCRPASLPHLPFEYQRRTSNTGSSNPSEGFLNYVDSSKKLSLDDVIELCFDNDIKQMIAAASKTQQRMGSFLHILSIMLLPNPLQTKLEYYLGKDFQEDPRFKLISIPCEDLGYSLALNISRNMEISRFFKPHIFEEPYNIDQIAERLGIWINKTPSHVTPNHDTSKQFVERSTSYTPEATALNIFKYNLYCSHDYEAWMKSLST